MKTRAVVSAAFAASVLWLGCAATVAAIPITTPMDSGGGDGLDTPASPELWSTDGEGTNTGQQPDTAGLDECCTLFTIVNEQQAAGKDESWHDGEQGGEAHHDNPDHEKWDHDKWGDDDWDHEDWDHDKCKKDESQEDEKKCRHGHHHKPGAVPLPAAGWLLLSGMAGFIALGRRRRPES